jgi:5'-nucleotidase
VVSGVNWGENLGAIIDHSGTIGAARTAARLGLPALAVSQGAGNPPDFASGAALAAQWLEDHRAELLDGTARPIVTSINVPTCPSGTVRGLMTVPVSVHPESSDHAAPDCASPLGNPVVEVDDVDAFLLGFATLSTFDGDLRPVG